MRVGLFITCLTDTLMPQVGEAVVSVLRRLGHDVVFPERQVCCGQMHANSGYRDEAMRIGASLIAVLGESDVDAVVAPSGSCVAMPRDQLPWLAEDAGDARLAEAALELGPRVYEFSEFLVGKLGVTDVGAAFDGRVAYHPACHSLRVLKTGDAARRLLEHVHGLELVSLPDAESCCGFGGLFSIKLADVSAAMLADKLAAVSASGAGVCTTVDSSCLMHIRGGIERQQLPIRAMHLAEILASPGAEA